MAWLQWKWVVEVTILVCGIWANNSVDPIIPKTPASAHFHTIICSWACPNSPHSPRASFISIHCRTMMLVHCSICPNLPMPYYCNTAPWQSLTHLFNSKKLPLLKEQILWLLCIRKEKKNLTFIFRYVLLNVPGVPK